MFIGTRLGIPMNGPRIASPRDLFLAGEQGVWYDPSDMSTLFQDSAGTTPVTAVEQPVGLMLDKSKGLVLGPELWAGQTPSINNAGSSDGVYDAVSRTMLVTTPSSLNGYPRYAFNVGMVPGKRYRVTGTLIGDVSRVLVIRLATVGSSNSIELNSGTGFFNGLQIAASDVLEIYFRNAAAFSVAITDISVREVLGNHAFQATSASRPVLSARVNLLLSTETLATQTVVTLATVQTLTFTGAGTITLSGTATSGALSAGTHSITTTAGNLTLTVAGSVTQADLRAANAGTNLPAYQRVDTTTDYDTVGFPKYLKFDGVDDDLFTNSIDFSATDEMTVFAGVRKLSTDTSIMCELSTNPAGNNGTFHLIPVTSADYQMYSKGTKGATSKSAGYPAPITNILTGTSDISGDTVKLRVNGSQVDQSTADQGTGNYGNYPLYIGARGGTSLFFNGHIYSLIIRGKTTDSNLITNTENYVNSLTKAY